MISFTSHYLLSTSKRLCVWTTADHVMHACSNTRAIDCTHDQLSYTMYAKTTVLVYTTHSYPTIPNARNLSKDLYFKGVDSYF